MQARLAGEHDPAYLVRVPEHRGGDFLGTERVLTPDGRVARYIYGTRMDPQTLQLALIDADWGRISESGQAIFDMVTGACFSYNYSEGRYQPNYALLAGVGSLLLGLSLMGLGFWAYRRKPARRPVHAP